MKKKTLILLFFILYTPFLLTAQTLKEKVKENSILFYKDMDSAYAQVDDLIKEAHEQQDYTTELSLLDKKCHYFYNKSDINNLLISAKFLKEKALEYKDKVYEASALLYLAESYSLNELPDKALIELNKAERILDKVKDTTGRSFYIQSNILISQSNIYYDRKEYEKGIAKQKELIKSGAKIKNQAYRDHFQYINYSNIANFYLPVNIDSAEYYVQKSMDLQAKDVSERNIIGANYFIIGKILEKRADTTNALKNYLKSYDILIKTGDALNRTQLYESLIEIYKAKKNTDSVTLFKNKLESFNINNLQNKYSSLQKIIKEEDNKKNAKTTTIIIAIIATSVILIIATIVFYVLRKKKIESKTEPLESEQEKLAKNYENLLELLRKDDPAFLSNFEEIFPDFRKKLLEINPELTISEITFCALLKLNLSTKKIADLTYIETRTVQNKKHRIRKRLNIPKNIDTYNWFETI